MSSLEQDDTKQTGTGDESQGETVPVEEWIPHPVSDSSVYLDGKGPVYGDTLTGEQKVEYDAAVAEKKKQLAPDQPPPRRPKKS